jgi:beta-1,4-mannosyltransferase
MKRIYVYPNILNLRKDIHTNPYIWNLCNSLSTNFEIIQAGKKPSRSLFLDIFKYISRTDYIYFNWIEEIALGKYGPFKLILYYVMLLMIKVKGVRIIFMLHNKKPHKSNKLSLYLLHDIIKRADILLTHSSEGIEVIKKIDPSLKAFLINHPFETTDISIQEENSKDVDILIWGTIEPYKGILEFLLHLKEHNLLQKYQIRIIGKIPDANYKKELFKYKSDQIIIEDISAEPALLKQLTKHSRLTLFTYKDNTVLSSGALMQALSYGAVILGPSFGAFKDLSLLDLIYAYENFDSMIKAINEVLNGNSHIDILKIQSYISNNSWDQYSYTLKEILGQNQ